MEVLTLIGYGILSALLAAFMYKMLHRKNKVKPEDGLLMYKAYFVSFFFLMLFLPLWSFFLHIWIRPLESKLNMSLVSLEVPINMILFAIVLVIARFIFGRLEKKKEA